MQNAKCQFAHKRNGGKRLRCVPCTSYDICQVFDLFVYLTVQTLTAFSAGIPSLLKIVQMLHKTHVGRKVSHVKTFATKGAAFLVTFANPCR